MKTVQEVVTHLKTIAAIKSINGDNHFSVAAIQEAAKQIETHNSLSVHMGDKLYQEVDTFARTGKSEHYETLIKKFPIECLTMMAVKGIGPKKAWKFYQQGIKNLDALVAEAEAGKLDAKLANAVFFARDTKAGRIPYDTAIIVGRHVIAAVNNVADITRAKLCGSLRRQSATIKDIDIVAETKKPKAYWPKIFTQIIVSLDDKLIGVNNQGDVKCSLDVIVYGTKMHCDIWLVEPWYYGSALNYATGSKSHTENLRKLAVKKGLKVNEYGIFKRNTENAHQKDLIISKNNTVCFVKGKGVRVGGENEEDLYRILGLEYVEPEDRE